MVNKTRMRLARDRNSIQPAKQSWPHSKGSSLEQVEKGNRGGLSDAGSSGKLSLTELRFYIPLDIK